MMLVNTAVLIYGTCTAIASCDGTLKLRVRLIRDDINVVQFSEEVFHGRKKKALPSMLGNR